MLTLTDGILLYHGSFTQVPGVYESFSVNKDLKGLL